MTLTCDEFITVYWRHYIALEKEFRHALQYVALDVDNYNVFSPIFMKLILQIGSEVDIVVKAYCNMLNANFAGENIYEYRKCIHMLDTTFGQTEVNILDLDVIIKPWEIWDDLMNKPSPEWWTAYNKVKHERLNYGEIGALTKQYYKFANLEHVLNALAGLYQVLICMYYKLASADGKYTLTPFPGSRSFKLCGGGWDEVNFARDIGFCIDDGNLYAVSGAFEY